MKKNILKKLTLIFNIDQIIFKQGFRTDKCPIINFQLRTAINESMFKNSKITNRLFETVWLK